MSVPAVKAPTNAAEQPSVTPVEVDASCRLPVLTMFVGAAVWLLIGTALALIASIKFHGPGFLADHAWLTYGRVRPAAWNALLYGGAMQAALGVMLWMFGRMGGVKLACPLIAHAGAKLWNLGVLAGFIGILAGASTGSEWLEMPRYAAVLVFLGYGLIAASALLTVHRRTVREFYPSQCFLLAALFWFPWIYSTANLLLVVRPVRGVAQAVIAWWYAANLHVVWFGLVGLGIVFYFVPKLLERPLHSRYLALVTFWGLLLFGSWTGIPASAPVPAWIPAISTVAAVLLLVPLLATVINFGRTVSGQHSALGRETTLRFVGLGFAAYVVSAVMNAAVGFPVVGGVTQFTWFVAAQHQVVIFGFFVLVVTGAVYHIAPRITGLPVCARCVTVHFWSAVLGIVLYAVPLAAGGVMQGLKLNTASVAFMDVVNGALMPLRVSTLGDALLFFASFVFVKNMLGLAFRLGRAWVGEFWSHATERPVQPAEALP